MKQNKENEPIITKIEVDQDTAEPIIVEVSKKDLPDYYHEEDVVIEKSDFVEHATKKGTAKQLAMKQLGFIPKADDSISKRRKTFMHIFTALFIVFVLGVLAFTFYRDFFASGKDFPDGEYLKTILKEGWIALLAAVICVAIYYFFKGLKLSVMCKKLTGKFHLKTCIETGVIGLYYNCITPLAVGGQPFEIYHLSKHGVHGGAAASLPIAAFFTNQLAFVIVGIVSLVLFKNNTFDTPETLIGVFPQIFSFLAIIGLCCCLIMPLLVIIFSLMPKFGAKVVKFGMFLGSKIKLVKNPEVAAHNTIKVLYKNSKCLKTMAKSPIVFSISMILSIGEQLVNASLAYFALRTFGYNIPDVSWIIEWIQVVQIALILSAAVSFIPTPGNSGAADLSFYLLFEASLLAGLAFPAMLLWRGLSFYSFILIGFMFATLKKKIDKRREQKNLPIS